MLTCKYLESLTLQDVFLTASVRGHLYVAIINSVLFHIVFFSQHSAPENPNYLRSIHDLTKRSEWSVLLDGLVTQKWFLELRL